ncbi:MAG: hypothetical protein M3345_00445 [Actinomycetota bacterium]|nr:hypothetical protein [Actinomycetota bacterium]
MRRATGATFLVVAVVLVAPACGREASDAQTKAAAEQAQLLDETRAELEVLTERTEELGSHLDELEAGREDAAAQLDRVSERLWASLAKVREAVSEAKSAGGAASSDADSALANASAALRDLTILENRFEYHLSQHGGN